MAAHALRDRVGYPSGSATGRHRRSEEGVSAMTGSGGGGGGSAGVGWMMLHSVRTPTGRGVKGGNTGRGGS